jgi:hypothetical protein
MRKREQDRVSPEDLRIGPAVLPRSQTDKPKEPSGTHARDLQHAVGNQAMMRLLQSGAIHAKLDVSQPGDPDEVEADRMAEQVVSPAIYRKCACEGKGTSCPACEEEEVEQAKGIHRKANQPPDTNESVHDDLLQSLGPGQPLDPQVREKMESAFGLDFEQVRIHADPPGASSARSVNARAFTADQHIVFGNGEYSPHSSSGSRLLAHELAHTVQNRKPAARNASASHSTIKRESLVGKASDWFSKKTEKAGKWVDEKKWAIYRAMIAGLKSQKVLAINLMRSLVPKLPSYFQSAASSIIDVADFFVDMEIALLLAIIGLAVGFAEGIVGLVVGLIKLAVGLLKMVVDSMVALMGKSEEFEKDLDALAAAVKAIPPGLTKIKDQWIERYQHATLEEQVLMGGELVGQIEAFIATFAFAGTKAGQATTLTVSTGETAVKVGAGGLAVLEPAPALAVTIPAVVPKTAAEAAVVSSQMMAMGATGAGGGGAGAAARVGEQKKKTPSQKDDEKAKESDQGSKAGEAEQSPLQKKYAERSKTKYPDIEWRRIEQLEERFPKLKSAKLRPVRRPGTGSEAIFEERMQTTQSPYSLAGYSSDGQQVIQFDGISPNGFIEEIKIEQVAGKVDDIVAQLRAQADFARDFGLRGVEYSIHTPAVADAVEARVAEEHLRNVYRLP